MAESKPEFRHKLPNFFKEQIESDLDVKTAWKNLTSLARNEWICWVTSANQEKTRDKRLDRAIKEIGEGKKRPCCWPGCPHRRESAKKWFK